MSVNESNVSWFDRRWEQQPKFDGVTSIITALTVLIHVEAVALYYLVAYGLDVAVPAQATDITIGFEFVTIIVVESLAIAVLWLLWSRLPDIVKKITVWGILASLYGFAGWLSYQLGVLVEAAVITAAVIFVLRVLWHFDLYWIVHDLLAIGMGIAVAAVLGTLLAPAVVIVMLALLLVWDHVAVNLSWIMEYIVKFSSSASLPNYIVVPESRRVDMGRLSDWIAEGADDRDDKPTDVKAVIGVGDFAIPGAFTASVAIATIKAGYLLPTVGVLVGTCCAIPVLVGAMQSSDKGLPALPWLNGGALAGFAVGLAFSSASAWEVLWSI